MLCQNRDPLGATDDRPLELEHRSRNASCACDRPQSACNKADTSAQQLVSVTRLRADEVEVQQQVVPAGDQKLQLVRRSRQQGRRLRQLQAPPELPDKRLQQLALRAWPPSVTQVQQGSSAHPVQGCDWSSLPPGVFCERAQQACRRTQHLQLKRLPVCLRDQEHTEVEQDIRQSPRGIPVRCLQSGNWACQTAPAGDRAGDCSQC